MLTFRAILALGPLAVYALVLATINLSRRPLVTTGTRDVFALGMGVMGLLVVGPIELLLPEEAAVRLRIWAWLMVGMMYVLSLLLVALIQRPRFTIYNADGDQVRQALAEAARQVDPLASWSADTLSLPGHGVQGVFECGPRFLRGATFTSVGDHQPLAGWQLLETALKGRLSAVSVRPGFVGAALLLAGLGLASAVAMQVVRDPARVAVEMREMFTP
jgi:hypothetical protein